MSSTLNAMARYGFILLALLCPALAEAHAVAGDRVFPATLSVDDPGVSDELTLPQVNVSRAAGENWTTAMSAEIDKRLTENLGVSAEGAWVGNSAASGWDNFGLGAKYVFLKNAPHETMMSVGLDWDMGGTGASRIAERFSTVSPGFFFGKGFGDLPDAAEMLKPLAVTGAAAIGFPTDGHDSAGDVNPRVLAWGATAQYSLPYLQQHVKDIGLGAPFNAAIPVIEFALQTPLNGPDQTTTGTANPGVIFMGQGFQLGLEAQLPLNRESGRAVGGMAQVHFYLDDLLHWGPLW